MQLIYQLFVFVLIASKSRAFFAHKRSCKFDIEKKKSEVV